jgi:hypothetical protein
LRTSSRARRYDLSVECRAAACGAPTWLALDRAGTRVAVEWKAFVFDTQTGARIIEVDARREGDEIPSEFALTDGKRLLASWERMKGPPTALLVELDGECAVRPLVCPVGDGNHIYATRGFSE